MYFRKYNEDLIVEMLTGIFSVCNKIEIKTHHLSRHLVKSTTDVAMLIWRALGLIFRRASCFFAGLLLTSAGFSLLFERTRSGSHSRKAPWLWILSSSSPSLLKHILAVFCTALLTLLMMTAESMLSKRPVLRITAALLFFLELFSSLIYCVVLRFKAN